MIRSWDEWEAAKAGTAVGIMHGDEKCNPLKRNWHISSNPAYTITAVEDKSKGLLDCTFRNIVVHLKNGKIPKHVLDDVITLFRQDLTKEHIIQIRWSGKEYFIAEADEMTASKTDVEFTFKPPERGTYNVMTIHSHNTMRAFPSGIDNETELGSVGCYGIIGNLDKEKPSFYMSVCYDGTREKKSLRTFFDVRGSAYDE